MTLIAVVHSSGRYAARRARRYVYQPLSWTPGGQAADGGGGGGAVGAVLFLLFLLLGCALAFVYRERLLLRLPPSVRPGR